VVTVVDGGDPTLVTGVSGMAGGAMSVEQLDALNDARLEGGQEVVQAAVDALGLTHADTHVAVGDPGTEIAVLAKEVGATVIVVGSRGLGAFKRALLGSVSDHLVRHAPCPVLVVRDEVED
jgi:nucleotide-binding universal stress UspA family protein